MSLIYAPKALATDELQAAFVAKIHDQTTAIAMETIAPNGYNGKIKIILAVDIQGKLLGVRTLEHHETPGSW